MRSDDLTREQAEAIKAKLTPMLSYLGRLQQRMIRRGFPLVDPLLCDVCSAYDAMHKLRVHVHYLTVKHGVGRPRRGHDPCRPIVGAAIDVRPIPSGDLRLWPRNQFVRAKTCAQLSSHKDSDNHDGTKQPKRESDAKFASDKSSD
jgi:hypothetical protein